MALLPGSYQSSFEEPLFGVAVGWTVEGFLANALACKWHEAGVSGSCSEPVRLLRSYGSNQDLDCDGRIVRLRTRRPSCWAGLSFVCGKGPAECLRRVTYGSPESYNLTQVLQEVQKMDKNPSR